MFEYMGVMKFIQFKEFLSFLKIDKKIKTCAKCTKKNEVTMRDLALRDEILLQVEKPARYIGGEVNSVMKDPEGKVRVAMCFPDVYEI